MPVKTPLATKNENLFDEALVDDAGSLPFSERMTLKKPNVPLPSLCSFFVEQIVLRVLTPVCVTRPATPVTTNPSYLLVANRPSLPGDQWR